VKIHECHFVPELLTVLVCLAGAAGFLARPSGGAAVSLELQSPDFTAGGNIPKQFTCDGANISPALSWNAPPADTQSFVLIADDPDAPAGTWVHWVIFDLPANLRALPQNFPKNEQLADASRQGRNDFGKIGYGGPCPPPGKPHRYFFKLYALEAKLNLKPGATKKDVERPCKATSWPRANTSAASLVDSWALFIGAESQFLCLNKGFTPAVRKPMERSPVLKQFLWSGFRSRAIASE
jgi:Raf kinase inhibitor-like YbhB/YbcL family protein